MRELHKLLNRECLSVTETEKIISVFNSWPTDPKPNRRHSRRLKSTR